MLSIISRVLIIIVVFVGGTLVGNIFMPQKELEQANLVSLPAPKTALNTDEAVNTDNALKSLKQMETALAASGFNPEELFSLQSSVRNALLLQNYYAAKKNYELELFRIQGASSAEASFLSARENFIKASSLLETYAPLKKQEEINIITMQPQATPTPVPTADAKVSEASSEANINNEVKEGEVKK